MKRYICTAVVAVTLTIVAGCGGGGEPAGSNSTPAATTTTTEAAAGEATVEQYASLVASHVGLWGEVVDNIDDSCSDPNAVAACSAYYLTASFQAESINIELTAAHDPACRDNPNCISYVGEVPDEITTLVADTEAAAEDYVTAYNAWEATGCADPLDSACAAGEGFAMSFALESLTQQFDAWSPYTAG
jgi:hypothetical protein